MASTGYAIYCIEVLNSKFQGITPLSLEQVEESWSQYVAHQDSTADAGYREKSNTEDAEVGFKQPSNDKNAKYPLFVTWNILGPNQSKNLRGCIGTFEAQPLENGLKIYALTASVHQNLPVISPGTDQDVYNRAFDDVRFQAIASGELPSLGCGVTLLTDFEATSSPMDWELDKHGLRVSFIQRSRKCTATYLPDVALEQGWSKTETMVSLMRKAGWIGRKEDWSSVSGLEVVRYQGLKVDASYNEWRSWRNWDSRHKQA